MPKIEREAEARNYGKFIISPLERGYGVTVGNALRRVLLSSKDVMRVLKLCRSSLWAEAVVDITVIVHANMIIARYFVMDLIFTPLISGII